MWRRRSVAESRLMSASMVGVRCGGRRGPAPSRLPGNVTALRDSRVAGAGRADYSVQNVPVTGLVSYASPVNPVSVPWRKSTTAVSVAPGIVANQIDEDVRPHLLDLELPGASDLPLRRSGDHAPGHRPVGAELVVADGRAPLAVRERPPLHRSAEAILGRRFVGGGSAQREHVRHLDGWGINRNARR